jgi:hypothetical protein
MTGPVEALDAEALAKWRGSRPDMLSYSGATGEQISFIYREDGERLEVGGGGDPVDQCAKIIEAHNALLRASAAKASRAERLEKEVERLRGELAKLDGSDPEAGDVWWNPEDSELGANEPDELYDELTDYGHGGHYPVKMDRARMLPPVWAVRVADDAVACFATEAEARAALASPPGGA